MQRKPTAVIPEASARMPCEVIASPHPAVIDPDRLSQQCELRTQRRSGPGGQHRNKTSSGVFLTHRATEIVGEATERRSQAHNRAVALSRLRYLIALERRTPSPLDTDAWRPCEEEDAIRHQFHRHAFRLSESNEAKPALLALVLNDLWTAGGQPSLVTDQWSVSTSKLVGLIRSHAPALALVNRIRSHHQRLPLH